MIADLTYYYLTSSRKNDINLIYTYSYVCYTSITILHRGTIVANSQAMPQSMALSSDLARNDGVELPSVEPIVALPVSW